MNTKTLVALLVVIMAVAGCKKSNNDNASKWVGTYSSIAGGGITNNYVNQVVVQESNSFILRMAFNNVSGSNAITYVTLQHVTLQSADSAIITESDSTLGEYSQVTYTGSASLNGDTIKILCNATDSTQLIPFNFYGLKQ